MVPHPVARAILAGQDRAVQVGDLAFPWTIGGENRVAGVLLKPVVAARHIGFVPDGAVIDEQLPWSGEIAGRLGGRRGGAGDGARGQRERQGEQR